jgi:predicted dehydrogenase/threonine dehydrogenase-like Zn-dependent dehydrogenase
LRQVVQNIKTGVVSVEEVPVPELRRGCLLVKNKASLISAGTEGGTVALGKMSLLGKARARPEQVKKVLQAVRAEGILATFKAVRNSLDVPIPLGYSCAGVVEAASNEISDIAIGAPVACGGAGTAYHADYVVVPRNLCVSVPNGVPFHHAAFTTVGAVAMQSVRVADVRLGEKVVVIGLGLVGLLAAEILKAGGCNVFGIDIDSRRVAWVEENGICPAVARSSSNIFDRVLDFSGGYGADAVIIAATTENNDPVVLAGELARHRGRVVAVGRMIMNAPRDTYLFKELHLCTSYAYGPGTEDQTYEIEGYDYPIGYVRWTENRNMQCFLDLLREKRIDISRLITHTLSIEKAPAAFDFIGDPKEQTIGVVLEYEDTKDESHTASLERAAPSVLPKGLPSERLRVGIIGAGSFATNVMVPLLARRKDVVIQTIASATGIKAAALAKKYGVSRCTSDAKEVIEAPDIDFVFILTRHGTHALFAEQALLANKHVFVEKPLALTEEGVRAVAAAREKSRRVLMIGFNRRFSPLAQRMKQFFSNRCQPMVLEFRGNVGYRPPEHWLHDPVEGGGVILGEACHYVDFSRWIVDSPVVGVDATCIGPSDARIIPEDNVAITLRFKDGSLASILYLSNGARGFSRERCEVHAELQSAVWQDFRQIKLVRDLGLPSVNRSWLLPKKGYKEELDAFFAAALKADSPKAEWLTGQLDASLATVSAAKCIRETKPFSLLQ